MVALRKKLVVTAAAVAAGTIGLGGIGVPLVEVAASAPAHLPSASGTLWVTDRTSALGSVKVFDAGTGTVIGTVTVGTKPTGVLAPHGTDKVYVSNGSPGNTVSVISKDSLEVSATIATGAGSDPHMAQHADGRFVFVALFGTRTVAVVDTSTYAVAQTLVASSNPSAKTPAVWVSSDGTTVYATNSFGSGRRAHRGPSPRSILLRGCCRGRSSSAETRARSS